MPSLAVLLTLAAHAKDTPVKNTKAKVHGLAITIEHPKGTLRRLHDDKGNVVYKKHMYNSYGYFNGTKGRDGDEVDCFLGPLKNAKEVYVVHMKDLGPVPSEREDEDKCMIGFPSADVAKAAFLRHYPATFFGGMTTLPVDVFKKKMRQASKPHRKKKITAEALLKYGKCATFRGLPVLLFLLVSAFAHAQTTITGTFKAPDGTPITGHVEVRLSRSVGVINTCTTPARIVAFKTLIVKITGGTLGALSLYPNVCLNPSSPYTVRVYDSSSTMLYQSKWLVPNTGSADVTQLDAK